MTDLSVSIVIPTYNRAGLVPQAINSALAASGPDDEIIVVDDGSTDGTEGAVSRFEERVQYLRVTNGGAGRARNIGIKAATKPLIAFLDSDDEWMPDKLQLQRSLMEARPDILFCFSNFAVREHSGQEHRYYLVNWHKDYRSWDDILGLGVPFSSITKLVPGRTDFQVHIGDLFVSLMTGLYVFTSTLLVRREAAADALHFAEDTPLYEDWECYGRLARKGLAAYLDCETTWNHGHTGARLSDGGPLERATVYIKLLERVWGTEEDFMTKHGGHYREIIAEQHLIRAKELLCMGQTKEAARELRLIPDAPLFYRMLTSVPGPILMKLLNLRRAFRS